MCKQNFAGSITYPQKSQIYDWVHKFQAIGPVNNFNKKAEIPDLSGNWLQDVLTMWMQWDILLEGVIKSPSEDVPKNLVFHAQCKIKSINFCAGNLVSNWFGFFILMAYQASLVI